MVDMSIKITSQTDKNMDAHKGADPEAGTVLANQDVAENKHVYLIIKHMKFVEQSRCRQPRRYVSLVMPGMADSFEVDTLSRCMCVKDRASRR